MNEQGKGERWRDQLIEAARRQCMVVIESNYGGQQCVRVGKIQSVSMTACSIRSDDGFTCVWRLEHLTGVTPLPPQAQAPAEVAP
jgi:hypothetical protein